MHDEKYSMSITNTEKSTWPGNTAVLIPAYKASEALAVFLPQLVQQVPASMILVVDDASADTTSAVCAEHGIACLKHEKNQGKGAALQTGFRHLLGQGFRWIISMDADGQHTVDDLPSFLEAARNNPDAGLIIGARSITLKAMPPARIFSNTVTSGILSMMCGQKILDSQCGYRIYSAELLRSIVLSRKRFEMESEVILKACSAGFAIRFVPVQTLYCSKQSHISHIRDMLRWIRAVIGVWIGLLRSGK